MKVYKGTDENIKCRGYQFEQGVTAVEDKAELCNRGFHACEQPIDVFKYYHPSNSRYFEAELEDVSDERENDDSKVVGKKITLGAELGIIGLVKAQIQFVKEHTTTEYADEKMATAGEYGAATAGFRGAATSLGSVSVGEYGVATVRGNNVKAKGGNGAILTLAEEYRNSYDVKYIKTIKIGNKYKPDVWYGFDENGKVVEK